MRFFEFTYKVYHFDILQHTLQKIDFNHQTLLIFRLFYYQSIFLMIFLAAFANTSEALSTQIHLTIWPIYRILPSTQIMLFKIIIFLCIRLYIFYASPTCSIAIPIHISSSFSA